MSDVELVALWLGLGAGLVSIVLALVAMVFTFAVDRRSSEINQQMIRSLQKIDSSVEGTAGDTKDLIKVAWDRMLPGPDVQPNDDPTADVDDESVKAIAAGVAAELRAELESGSTGSDDEIKRLNRAVARMERTMQAQLHSAPAARSSARTRFARLQTEIDELSPVTRELLKQLAQHGHLERGEYRSLQTTSLKDAIRELRDRGLITPLSGHGEDGGETPVYWFSPSLHQMIKPALDVSDPVPRHVQSRVKKVLQSVGYLKEDDAASVDPGPTRP